jgi:hypothetical protein
MEIVKYILGDLFHFIGFVIILVVLLEGIVEIIKAFRK